MVRGRVDRARHLRSLEPPSQMECCDIPPDQVGMPKPTALKGWFEFRAKYDIKWASLGQKSEFNIEQ